MTKAAHCSRVLADPRFGANVTSSTSHAGEVNRLHSCAMDRVCNTDLLSFPRTCATILTVASQGSRRAMATYFLRTKHVSRGKGARVARAAASRAGERIRDERTSEVYDYADRRDVAYKEIILPAELTARSDMAWTQDRSTLWNAAEHAGLRRNSRLAREWLRLLPPELSPAQRTSLVRTFASELADKYRCAVDVCIHQPRPGADPRNHHAHLLMTTREVTPEGFGARTSLEISG